MGTAAAVTFPERSERRVRSVSLRTWRMVLGTLAVLSLAAAIPLSVLSDQVANLVIAAVIGLPSAAIGVLVTRRQPGNPLGWLFLVSAVCQFIGTDGGGYALLAYQFGHHLPLASVALALDQIWGPSLVVFAVSILLFPDGRLPGAQVPRHGGGGRRHPGGGRAVQSRPAARAARRGPAVQPGPDDAERMVTA